MPTKDFHQSSDQDAVASLMARLNSQFGDLDLEQLNASLQGKSPQQSQDEDCPDDEVDKDAASSEESSLAEPTAEELAAWQARQFQKGNEIVQRQKEETMDPIQKRRLAMRHGNAKQSHSHQDGEDWVEIASLPDLQCQSSIFFSVEESKKDVEDDLEDGVIVGVAPLLKTLATSPKGDPELLGTAWHRLYSSVEGDGLSFFNLCHEICHYDGPTLMLLNVVPSQSKLVVTSANSPKASAAIGFFTTTTWQESPDYYGNYSDHDKAFLFAMDEQQNLVEFFNLQSTTANENRANRGGYMYCHPSTKSTKRRGGNNYHPDKSDNVGNRFHARTNGAVHGIGIGGKPSQPRLHLTETLEECRCLTYDTSRSLHDGNLFMNKPAFEDSLYYFDVESIEVWGVGGKAWINDALQAREKARAIAASNLEQRRRIYDKTQMMDDFRNGLYSTTTKSAASGSHFDHVVYNSDRCDV
jgi:TLD